MNENKYVEMLEDGTLYDYIIDLLKQNEAYKNMRKEAIEYIKSLDVIDKDIKIDYCIDEDIKDDLLNILNKVGEDNE